MRLQGKSKVMEIKLDTSTQAYLTSCPELDEYHFIIPEDGNHYFMLQTIDLKNNTDYEYFREFYCRLAFQQHLH